ncbi:hypothetical protein E1I18_01145 [Mycoplasmopsis mucosicanis]|uniref:Uncharacterized protein n=1 Tax=Mycoplasmopsis mucosicanis TaxID=458208 RepID=A0A507SY39_9BACT|nr:hypothetical protein [Mycoplasmopsis mucosicanis]TQC54048.1 hypothetical protein E1I18_01145 [Mycoplasmopsis mucosicanis]
MKRKNVLNIDEIFPNKGYDSKSLFNSLLKANKELENDVVDFMKLKPNANFESFFDEVSAPEFNFDKVHKQSFLNKNYWISLKNSFDALNFMTQTKGKNFFKSISFQHKTLSKLIEENAIEMQYNNNIDLGLDSRFNSEDTLTLSETSEIVINKVKF